MGISMRGASPLMKAYSLARNSKLLETSLGRKVFKSAYFLYKRYIEDDLRDLVQAYPSLLAGGDLLDIGANIGYTAAVLARATAPAQKVYAFEPELFNFAILQQTAAQRSSEGKIIPVQCAVGAASGMMELWINPSHHADHRIVTEQFRSTRRNTSTVSVPLISIDSFLENRPAPISFVKIDVQGYELAVCEGMQRTLQQNPDIAILLEFMPSAMEEMGFESSRLIEFFAERGFRAYQLHPHGKLTQGIPKTPKESSYVDLLFIRRDLNPRSESR